LNTHRLTYLFKALYNANIISVEHVHDIQKMIAHNFQPISKKNGDNLSTGKLQKIWSDINPNDIAFWEGKFIDLHNNAKKDNPNKVKYKEPKR